MTGTLGAQITDAGVISPSYADILAQIRITYFSIYGSDAVLDDDSADGQFLAAAIAQPVYDSGQSVIAAYNAFSPDKAVGAQLSSIVKINGIRRLVPTNSEVAVTLSGTVGTQVIDGVIGDNVGLGTKWDLPALVTIGDDGTVQVTATCQTEGDVLAGHDTLTDILTPTLGWQSVTNGANDTTAGQPVETDAALRTRQTNSVALPALAIVDGVEAAVAAVDGVARLYVYENDTDITDTNGIPSHSISVVVSGGDISEIAAAIALKKPPGTGTYGTTSQIIFDSRGVPRTIRFFELDAVPMKVQINIHPIPGTGYVSTTGDALKQAVVDFVNGLDIGEDSYLARLYTPANTGAVGLGATYVVTAITQAKVGDALAAADVAIAFNEGATLTLANTTLVIV